MGVLWQLTFTSGEGKWILVYLGLASSLSLDHIQSPLCNDRMTCTGKGCDRCSQPHPAQSYSCNTPRCPNRNVFCKPQDLLTIPLHIYLPVSETLKYNMDSNLPGFLVVPYEKYNLISCFLSMFCIYFCSLEKILDTVICITSKKIKLRVWTQAPCSVIHIGGNSQG